LQYFYYLTRLARPSPTWKGPCANGKKRRWERGRRGTLTWGRGNNWLIHYMISSLIVSGEAGGGAGEGRGGNK
ncbi:unnamed protein product, partial [Choristocarpus tenellus]